MRQLWFVEWNKIQLTSFTIAAGNTGITESKNYCLIAKVVRLF